MDCPKCGLDMEFEEAKNWHGYWYCDCGFEAPGSNIPCGSDGVCINDYEEQIERG